MLDVTDTGDLRQGQPARWKSAFVFRIAAPACWLLVTFLVALAAPRLMAAQAADSARSPALVALGDSIFHGKAAGGICFTCHGANAKGTPGLAPNLTDNKWLHGDGSYVFIVGLVEKGVPKPKEAVAPMLPKGGANLTPAQIRAVSAYVYSLSHK